MDTAQDTIEIEQLSDDELGETFIRACRVRDQQSLFIARCAAEMAKREKHDDDGFVSPIDWLRFNGHMTSGAAANSVAVGEAVRSAIVDSQKQGRVFFHGSAVVKLMIEQPKAAQSELSLARAPAKAERTAK